MSFLSFLSSHRMHFGSHHRAWIDPLPVQLDLIRHEAPPNHASSVTLGPGESASPIPPLSATLGAVAGGSHAVGFADEPGP